MVSCRIHHMSYHDSLPIILSEVSPKSFLVVVVSKRILGLNIKPAHLTIFGHLARGGYDADERDRLVWVDPTT